MSRFMRWSGWCCVGIALVGSVFARHRGEIGFAWLGLGVALVIAVVLFLDPPNRFGDPSE